MIKPEDQNIEIKVSTEGDRIHWIKEIGWAEDGGSFQMDLWSTLEHPSGRRGELYTYCAISTFAYRKHQPTKARVVRLSSTSLRVFDDGGGFKDIATDAAIVSALIEEAKQYQLYQSVGVEV